MHKIKSNKTISNAITKATGAVSQSTDIINKRIDEFEAKTTEMFNKFEEKFEKRFEEKFVDLKNKRIEAYNSIMTGKDKLKEVVADVKKVATDIQAEVQKEPEKPDIKELEEALNIDKIKEDAKELEKQAQETIVTVVDETSNTIKEEISQNQVLR